MPGANLAVGKNSKNALVSSRVPKLENYFMIKKPVYFTCTLCQRLSVCKWLQTFLSK